MSELGFLSEYFSLVVTAVWC